MNAVYEASCLGFTNSSIGRIFQTHFWLDQMFRWTFTQEKPGSGRLLELMMWSAKVAFVAMSKHSLPLSGRTRGIHYVGCSHLQPELVDIFWWLMSEITVKIECVGKKKNYVPNCKTSRWKTNSLMELWNLRFCHYSLSSVNIRNLWRADALSLPFKTRSNEIPQNKLW